MWWRFNSSTCSCPPSRSRAARTRGPRARSNGRAASSAARRRASAVRSAAGRAVRSMPGRAIARRVWRRDHLHRPPSAAKVVRSASWRRTIVARICASQAGSSAPCDARAPAGCCRPRPGSRRSRNHSRSWAKESGGGPVSSAADRRPARGSPRRRAPRRARPRTRRASSRTVGASKSARTGSSTPKTPRSRDITRVASSEWPPRSKKLRWDRSARPPPRSRVAQNLAPERRDASRGPRGASDPAPGGVSGAGLRDSAGRALRSILPFGVSGSAARRTNDEGHHRLGQPLAQERAQHGGFGVRLRPPRRPEGDQPGAGRPLVAPAPPPPAPPDARRAPPRSRPARSGSRAPSPDGRARPRKSSSPPGRKRARSPVR